MSDQPNTPRGPDLSSGIAADSLADGAMIAGHVGDDAVLLARAGDEYFATGATCTHYGGPLADGILEGTRVRCPWHHGCFDLRTGNVERAPALRPIPCWKVERRGDRIVVGEKIEPRDPELGGSARPVSRRAGETKPSSVLIVGAGAAGSAAADTLRREGYDGPITMIDGDTDAPYDRPNLSKDYLAGNAPEEWIPLRPPEAYRDHGIDLRRGTRVASIDVAGKRATLADGSELRYGALLLATGSRPARLPAAVTGEREVRYLRTLGDSRAIIEAASRAGRAVVIGASFIGLEVAASLRARGLEVHVVAPEQRPLERALGPALGDLVRGIHEQHEVRFHLGRTAKSMSATEVTLDDGTRLAADLVVAGVGVRLDNELAKNAGLAGDRGVDVDETLRTSAESVFAAGDIAFWPDVHSGERIHVEHWVVAERQGQVAARNILGAGERFDAVPFFWSAHYDLTISYVGHAEKWDRIDVDGKVEARDCAVRYVRDGKVLAVATVGRDRESLESELRMERGAR